MIIVVSDTSPLNYLLLCGAVDVLPRLFGRIVIPNAVLAELQSDGAPAVVRAWAMALPVWAEVQAPTNVDAASGLHSGERDAICLALEIGADLLLIDERIGQGTRTWRCRNARRSRSRSTARNARLADDYRTFAADVV